MTASPFRRVSIDAIREFWDGRPCNVRHSPSAVGTKQYFDEVERRKYFVEPHIPVFAEFDRWKGKRVLEVGCGIGTDTMNFARAGAEVSAVDARLGLAQARLDLEAARRALVNQWGGIDPRFAVAEGELELLGAIPALNLRSGGS